MLDLTEFKTLLGLTQATTVGLLKIFDPKGDRLLQERGLSRANMRKVRVNIIEVMACGVLMSKLISRRHKLIFLCGLFDFDSSGKLTEQQWTLFTKALYHGIAAVLSISRDEWPGKDDIKQRAASIFKDIDVNGNGHIELSDLYNWSLGENSNTNKNALYWKLLLRRFSAERYGCCPENFDDCISNYRLNWKEPKLPPCQAYCPKHKNNILACEILSRQEVVSAKAFFEEWHGQQYRVLRQSLDGETSPSHGTTANRGFQQTLQQTMSTLTEQYGNFDITALLRVLCPCAQAKHIKMFLNWCDQHEAYCQTRREHEILKKGKSEFRDYYKKPIIPHDVLRSLERQFDDMAGGEDGRLTIYDLQRHWGWSRDEAQEMLGRYDVDGDDFIDQHEFVQMMCPPEYRLDIDDALLQDLFQKWFSVETKIRKRIVKEKHRLKDVYEFLAPSGLLPAAPEYLLRTWEDAFRYLDKDRSGTVEAKELASVVNDNLASLICALLNTDVKDGFTKDDFLYSMCQVQGYCPPAYLNYVRSKNQCAFKFQHLVEGGDQLPALS